MVYFMSKALEFLSPDGSEALRVLGANIAAARKRRRKRQADIARQAMMSPVTYGRIERGDPTVQIGLYVAVLALLGLAGSLEQVAAIEHDPLAQGRRVIEGTTGRVRLTEQEQVADDDF